VRAKPAINLALGVIFRANCGFSVYTLADNFKIPENGVLRLAVAKKNGFTFGGIVCNSNKAVPCVCKKHVWILSLHNGTASLRIRRAR
jgi:hypothetical protein